MRTILIAIAIAISTVNAAMAETPKYTFEASVSDEAVCSNTDVAIAIVVGVVGGAVLGVTSIIGAPVVGAGVTAGTTMSWGMAFSAPFLTNATASLAAGGAVLVGPIVGMASYYVSCASRAIF